MDNDSAVPSIVTWMGNTAVPLPVGVDGSTVAPLLMKEDMLARSDAKSKDGKSSFAGKELKPSILATSLERRMLDIRVVLEGEFSTSPARVFELLLALYADARGCCTPPSSECVG